MVKFYSGDFKCFPKNERPFPVRGNRQLFEIKNSYSGSILSRSPSNVPVRRQRPATYEKGKGNNHISGRKVFLLVLTTERSDANC